MTKTSGSTKGESMQNKTLSFLGALCLSTALLVQPAFAQQAPAKETPKVAEQKPAEQKPVDTAKKQAVDAALGENVAIDPDKIVDFPGRPSLGSIEMATLPGINESLITGPAPMGESLSSKDLPSEQLLGRITTEVFQEMADLERGNAFLKLQNQKETLKNELENLRAQYRQKRLDEIAKREDVVRSRINWWQEQETIRIEMERKKAETEAIEQQIAEAEELRNKLRTEALAEKESGETASTTQSVSEPAEPQQQYDMELPPKKERSEEAAPQPEPQPAPAVEEAEPEVAMQPASELYTLLGVRGLKGRLTARLENKEDGGILNVKKGQKLKTGHKIIRIDRDTVQMSYAGRIEVILLASPKAVDMME